MEGVNNKMIRALSFEIYEDTTGKTKQYRWRLKAANNRIIANSGEAYHNLKDCLDAIQIVKSSTNSNIFSR